MVKKWRRQLHAWDPPAGDGESGIALKDAVAETRSMFETEEEDSAFPENENALDDDTEVMTDSWWTAVVMFCGR